MEPAEYAAMDAAEASMWWYRALHARLLDALVGTRGPVLDAGCGTGGFLAVLRARRPDLPAIGLEYDAAAAARARAKSAAPVARGSIDALPFAPASFAAVIAADVLCHRSVDPRAALRAIHAVLKPGGRLVLNLPAFRFLYSDHDRQVHNATRFTRPEVRRLLLAAGFRNVRAQYWNSLLLPVMVVRRKLLARDAPWRLPWHVPWRVPWGARGDTPSRANLSDVAAFSPWIDAMLHGMTTLERRIPLALPAGGSVLAVAETA